MEDLEGPALTGLEIEAHTPGPWVACGFSVLAVPDSVIVASTRVDDESGRPLNDKLTIAQIKANARLIAAAPAMFTALEKLMALGTGYGEASDLIRLACKPVLESIKQA